MTEVITIGVDLAKNVYQVHGVDGSGGVVFRRQLRRGQMLPFFKKQPLCLVGMEACANSHHSRGVTPGANFDPPSVPERSSGTVGPKNRVKLLNSLLFQRNTWSPKSGNF
jgi:hypothetical protein